MIFYISQRCLKTGITSSENTFGMGCSLHFWPGRDLKEGALDTALLLFFTGADLAEAKEPVEETTTSEEALEEILPWGPPEVLPK